MISAICIDSSNKPDEIPLSEWINKGAQYTISHVYFHPVQGISGAALQEVRLTDRSYPYESYRLNRFAVTQEGLTALMRMIADCTELNQVDIEKLIKESELQTIKSKNK